MPNKENTKKYAMSRQKSGWETTSAMDSDPVDPQLIGLLDPNRISNSVIDPDPCYLLGI